MKRRRFLKSGVLVGSGWVLRGAIPMGLSGTAAPEDLYRLFKDPDPGYRPYVRWWWNGDKVDKEELARELRLLKKVGIGGVEINPIKFPPLTEDMDKPSIPWLSAEWIGLLQFTLQEAASLGLTCDLIVGSGWPFGAEWLEGEERSQVVLAAPFHLEGPVEQEFAPFDFFKLGDAAISSPYPGRTMELLSVNLVPDPLDSMDQVTDLSDQIAGGILRVKVPRGKHVLYGLVKVNAFSEVINGAPGANGPVLNHYNQAAVQKYLHHMSDTIQRQMGPLAGQVRAFFTDSMELEGANWCADMADEFRKRKGYDLLPYLPFLMYKIQSLGNWYDFYTRKEELTEQEELERILKNFDYPYGAALGPAMKDMVQRVRYDFDVVKSDLINERFVRSYTQWCRDNKVLSRVQAYGRGYYPLEGSFEVDIPECETWVKRGLGEKMSEVDCRVGRAYTMINKFVSSAAHLKGKRQVSCEELTNTERVFNSTLELLKVAGDQSAISGVTHPVFHGFNYSPPDAAFPGWIRYGTFINERNTWWPYFRRFTDYKARLSALLQNAEMFADIAVLPAVADLWSIYSAQNEPFPSLSYPPWLALVWESIHHNGNACDYISEQVIRDATIKDGWLQFGPRRYHTLFLAGVERMEPATVRRLFDFVVSGGRIFCLGTEPHLSAGWKDPLRRDAEVKDWVLRMKEYPDRWIVVQPPEKDFIGWYRALQRQYGLVPYVGIDQPDPYVQQVRYRRPEMDILLFINSHLQDSHIVRLSVSKEIAAGRQAWIWDAETGERWRLEGPADTITLDLAPADARLLVFDKTRKGQPWRPIPAKGEGRLELTGPWELELRHIDGSVKKATLGELKDLKDTPEYAAFAGDAIYRGHVDVKEVRELLYLNLGRVAGVCELIVNGKTAGVRWYGRRIYEVGELIRKGSNSIEIRVTTVMGNYMKSLTGNAVAQKWANQKRQDQPMQSLGLLGPVTLYI